MPANSAIGYFLFAFVAMVGLCYVNFLPGVVSALAGGIGFSEAQAGQIVAANGYGGLAGSVIAIFLIRHIKWKTGMFLFLTLLAGFDLATLSIVDYNVMLGWRFLAGVFGGLGIGIGFAVLARLPSADRAFGTLLFIQFIIGSLVMYLLPILEAKLTSYAVFYVMAAFSVLSLLFLSFLPELANQNDSETKLAVSYSRWKALLLMLALLCYLCAASAIWAYAKQIGLNAGMDERRVSTYIATTGMLGLIGALLPMLTGNRFGRLPWLVSGVVLSVSAAVMLTVLPLSASFYVFAMSLLFFAWPAVNSYLFAVAADMDKSGRLSTIAAVVSQLGLASGPLMASRLLNDGHFLMMLYGCAALFLLSLLLLIKSVKVQEKVSISPFSTVNRELSEL